MKNYRAVGNTCAVDMSILMAKLSATRDEILVLLHQKGFAQKEVDLISLARECIGSSRYRRGARGSEAPGTMDCSSFTKWLYGQKGIWLPRRSIQQRDRGQIISQDDLVSGDLVFTSGWKNYFHDTEADGVGHVGIATGDGTIVHASNSKVHVVESTLADFLGKNKFRGARRYIPVDHEIISFVTPRAREVEISDDVLWILLQSL